MNCYDSCKEAQMGGSPSIPPPPPPLKPPEPPEPFSSFDLDREKKRRSAMGTRRTLTIPKNADNVGPTAPQGGGGY